MNTIMKAVKETHPGKSAGSDLNLNEFFINGKDVLTPYLHTLFNKVFTLEYFPSSWSEGYVISLHTKGSQRSQ